jgi:hypothetical protein
MRPDIQWKSLFSGHSMQTDDAEDMPLQELCPPSFDQMAASLRGWVDMPVCQPYLCQGGRPIALVFADGHHGRELQPWGTMNEERCPTSASDAMRGSIQRPEPKQRLLKEVVTGKTGADPQKAISEAGKQVSAGRSLYMAEIHRAAEKARG